MPQRKPLHDDARFLFSFEAKLNAIERDLQLAKIIGYYERADDCRHPVLGFAFRHAPNAVMTAAVLRLSEALELHFERASSALLHESLWTGRGRNRRLVDPDFQRLRELRDARVAHGIKLEARGDAAVVEAREASGTVIAFLLHTITKLRALLDRLRRAGLFDGVEGLWASVIMAKEFSKDDLDHLIATANALLGPAASDSA